MGEISSLDSDTVANMTCYQNGATVRQNHQMCNVTSENLHIMVDYILLT
jgi:hypothetical protein